MLEGSVQEAQESESHILELQKWVTHVDALLTARVENDLTADDLPDDDQVCVATLFTMMTGSVVSVSISQESHVFPQQFQYSNFILSMFFIQLFTVFFFSSLLH